MKLLAGRVFWIGGLVALLVLAATYWGAPMVGLDAVSIVVGALLGMAISTGYLVWRVVEPLETGVDRLTRGEAPEDPALAARCHDLLAAADAGKALIERLSGNADANAISAAEVAHASEQLKRRLDQQVTDISQMADYAGQITETVRQSAQQADEAAETARDASRISADGRDALAGAIERVRQVHEQSGENLRLIQDLNEKSNRIQGVTGVIEGIAEQTNLLALNAAIEAARAGEQGRGFAVVADEVRQLAGRTAQATGEVAQTLEEVRADTAQIVARIEDLASSVETGLQAVEGVGERLDEIRDQADQLEQRVGAMAANDQHNEQSLQEMFRAIESQRDQIAESDHSVEGLAQQATRLMELAEEANAAYASHSDTSYHQFFYHQARAGARRIGDAFEQALKAGRISDRDLFDSARQPLPGTDPQKYSSGFDRFTDEVLPAIQEPIKDSHPAMVFAIAAAPDGYVPTHNRDFAHPPSGDPTVDLVKSRSKRLFADRTGVRCGSHTEAMLLQTYRRDTGEIMHDLSVPIYVNGRHWGGLRLGYRPNTA
ncbi:methyl-accepting chemotaxis protein [Marinobacter xestospongiae]|uniref:Methyl-accepting chemotaxis protein n=1 Tax=Marinobacter xestospongiae TaxID=994319 RepID=A0ABU3VU95_9GAMM|nr:methyl-accepting chemotaxis protein [Marinobacter xestospongiae]MDV2077839.1 methyl-accepting chemotaxis protein [Marinobacter xestospongiae]